jgi:hypothetical protein
MQHHSRLSLTYSAWSKVNGVGAHLADNCDKQYYTCDSTARPMGSCTILYMTVTSDPFCKHNSHVRDVASRAERSNIINLTFSRRSSRSTGLAPATPNGAYLHARLMFRSQDSRLWLVRLKICTVSPGCRQ